MKEENLSQENASELNQLLKILLSEKAKEAIAKEEKEVKDAKESAERIQSQIEAAIERNEQLKRIREGCIHQTVNPANGNRRSAWRAQVNSDGTFSPVCGICQTVMPKIVATDEQKREGVNLHNYVEISLKALEGWHKKSYPLRCDFDACYLCHPVAELATA